MEQIPRQIDDILVKNKRESLINLTDYEKEVKLYKCLHQGLLTHTNVTLKI